MKFIATGFRDLFLIELDPKADERGFFARTFCEDTFVRHGLTSRFPQCGSAFNRIAGTVRGMHFRTPPHAEVKVVRCTRGAIHDVVVDIRPDSPTYLKCYHVELSATTPLQLYVPTGFAHGYQTLHDASEVHYMLSQPFVPGTSDGLRWDDPALSLVWPRPITVISEQDLRWPLLPASHRS